MAVSRLSVSLFGFVSSIRAITVTPWDFKSHGHTKYKTNAKKKPAAWFFLVVHGKYHGCTSISTILVVAILKTSECWFFGRFIPNTNPTPLPSRRHRPITVPLSSHYHHRSLSSRQEQGMDSDSLSSFSYRWCLMSVCFSKSINNN